MSVTNYFVAAWIEWITKINKDRLDNPPKLEELIKDNGLGGNAAPYTQFADRMVRAGYGEIR